MPKTSNLEYYPFQTVINLDDVFFGWRGSDGKNVNYEVSDVLSLITQMLGLDVLMLVVTAAGDEIQNDSLIGATQIISITGENMVYTDFSAFTDFELNGTTGIISGFPFTTGAKYIIAYTTREDEEEE